MQSCNPFWSTYKPYKHAKGDADILIIENKKILLDNRQVANVFNNYFQSITKNIDLLEWPDELEFDIFDEIDLIINKFRSFFFFFCSVEYTYAIFTVQKCMQKNNNKRTIKRYYTRRQTLDIILVNYI